MVKKITIGARIRPSYNEKLERIAKEKEMNKSELVREIVENFINMHT